jgi:PAS domain-containing protein
MPDSMQIDRNLWVPGMIYPRREAVELIDSLQYQRGIIESVGIGILIVDKDTRIINANMLACEMLGRPEDEVFNQPVSSLFTTPESLRLVDALSKLVKQRDNRKCVFKGEILSKPIRFVITLFRVGGKYAGWIVALEEEDIDSHYSYE